MPNTLMVPRFAKTTDPNTKYTAQCNTYPPIVKVKLIPADAIITVQI